MEKKSGINNDDLKKKNRGLLLRLLALGDASTRMQLTKRSGLSKMTVTNIMDEFIEKKVIVEGEKQQERPFHKQGRKPSTLQFSPSAPKIIGCVLNREYCSTVLCDFQLNIMKMERQVWGRNAKADFLSTICRLIDKMMEGEQNIIGIGIASIGPLNVQTGDILSPPRFYDIRNIPITKILSEHYHLPVCLDHQYNSAARAELMFGQGKSYPSFVFVGVTNGIGAGLSMDGKILQSSCGLGSELGHMSIDYNGILCDCGSRGCVEKYSGINVICSKVEKSLKRSITFEECCTNYTEPMIYPILSDAVEKLGVCLVNVVNLMNPDVIFMGDESVSLPDCLMQRMEKMINERKISSSHHDVKVRKASYGKDQQLLGAVCNVLDSIFSGQIVVS